MFWLIYLLSAILCIWGGCLLARVIANRLELGLFRRKRRKEALEAAGSFVSGTNTPTTSGMPEVKRRSGWWTLVGLGVMLFGGGVAFVHDAVSAMITNGREWRSEDIANHLMTTALLMSLGLSGGLAVVGFRFDPSLGRRRCPTCWYDMNATKGRLCPECGHEASSDRQLYRSKRSRVTIALAITSLLVYPTTTRMLYASRVGPIGLIPTTVMVLAWEWLPEKVVGSGSMAMGARPNQPGSLASRLQDNATWEWQRNLFRWRCREAVRSATDLRLMFRASMLHSGGLQLDKAFVQTLRPRLGRLIKGVDWTDPESRTATQWLVMSITPAIDSVEVQEELVRHIVAEAPTLLRQMATPPVGWDTAALMLLGYPGVADAMGQPWLDAMEAYLAATTTPSFHRLHCLRVLYENSGDSFMPIVERVLGKVDSKTRFEIAQAGLGTSRDPLFVNLAVEIIQTSSTEKAEQIVANLFRYPNPQVREACLRRFLLDQYHKPACLQAIRYSMYNESWSDQHLSILETALAKTLRLSDDAAVRDALNAIGSETDLSELMRPSLEELAKSPGTRNGAIAKTILERLPPTPQAEPEKSP